MNILIPMAGRGKRFADARYAKSKPSIMTIDRRTGKLLPMVVCATLDIPGLNPDGGNVIYVDRTCHREDGTETLIRQSFPNARFVTIDEVTEGQACTCLKARSLINNDEELLISGCDNGMVYSLNAFEKKKFNYDVLVFTFRHNEAVLRNPNAYGWMVVDENESVVRTSIKKAISNEPMNDHAVVATFWFRRGCDFVDATDEMIAANDRINGEFYVDQVIKYAIMQKLRVGVFEIDRYICWGTPDDFENYQKTFIYWQSFLGDSRCFLNLSKGDPDGTNRA